MRVTALEPSGNLYGSEYCLLDVIEVTASQFEWEVVLPPGGGFDKLLATRGIKSFPFLKRDLHTLPLTKKLGSYWNVRRHIARMRPDVVYVNQAGMLRAANAMTKGIGTELVCQIQTLEDAKFIAARPGEQSRVRTFMCNSEFIANAAGVPREKVTVLYQPMLPRNRPVPSEPPASRSPWLVGILGRISETKGHYLLLEAAKLLLQRGRTDISFVVIGEAISPGETRKFERAVSDAGLSMVFDLRGYRVAAHEELARLHALVIPSPAEPYGRVLLDAAATRRPVVVSDGGGLGELNRHFGIGVSFPAESADGLASAIEKILNDYDGETVRFNDAAERMLKRLDPAAYSRVVATIMTNAAKGQSTSMNWFGEPR